MGLIKEEFEEFKAEVRGQLEGFSKAIVGFSVAIKMNKR